MNYNVYPYLDKRSTGKDGKHPIKIAIGYNRKADYINTTAYATTQEWQQLFSDKVPKHLREVKDKIVSIETSVRTILATTVHYDIKVIRKSIADLAKPLLSPTTPLNTYNKPADLFHWFDIKIKELQDLKEALGTAESYKNSKSFYMKYTGESTIDFRYFTKEALYIIQKKALTDGMALGNIYRHARQLRAVFNMAICERAIDNSIYPFHKRGYTIPQTTKKKKALGRDNIAALLNYTPKNEQQRTALDYFIFSFFGNGMNMKDVAYLKFSDLLGNTLHFVRKKTANTTLQPKEIKVAITQEMHEVIERQGNPIKDAFIFPIIDYWDTPARQRLDYRRFHKKVNDELKQICILLGFTQPVTHGVSRYTFANALKQQGVSIDYISEAMGHSSTAVTEHYLNSFEDNIVTQHAEKLREYGSNPIKTIK